jgi:methyl-accepting chemotaxis protein
MTDQVNPNQPDDNTEEFVDALEEVAENEDPTATSTSSDDNLDPEVAESNAVADTLLSLQNLIERNANELDRLNGDLKEMRQSLKNIFDNDPALSEATEQAQKATTEIKERKQQIDNNPEVRQLKLKMVDLKEEMKEIEETLNNHLINLFQMTGSNSFDTSDGDQREFVLRAKVKPKGAKAS